MVFDPKSYGHPESARGRKVSGTFDFGLSYFGLSF
jgi:hypothetical protein